MKPRYTYRPKSIYPSGKISYRMVFKRIRSSKICRRRPVKFDSGPLAGKTLYMAGTSNTLRFTILIAGNTYTGYYDDGGQWVDTHPKLSIPG